MTGSTGCPPGEGTVETWCDTDGNCEVRVVGGPFYRCNTSDTNSCLRATEQAAEACRSQASVDGGAGDGSVEGDGSVGNDGRINVPDAGPCPGPTDEVDLLFMVDNSGSMTEEQTSLAMELPRLVHVLASGDVNQDGNQDFQPVRSLHIGVVTSDMGVGGFTVPSCELPMGDDGRLLNIRRVTDPTCTGPYPTTFEFQRGVDDVAAFAQQVGCVARTGTSGCAFEQQLEAVLKAVSPSRSQDWTIPSYVPPLFLNRTSGHADGANAGFVRPNSALAIIMVTDEEDCSASDVNIFDLTNESFTPNLNLRCSWHPEATHPIERYVRGEGGQSGLLGLRRHPNRLIFAGIVGVPVESVPDPSAIDYEAILDHPLMQEVEDLSMPGRLVPSCNVPGRGLAFPPRRIVGVAQGIEAAGGGATIQSICQSSFTGALEAIIRKIAPALEGTCSSR